MMAIATNGTIHDADPSSHLEQSSSSKSGTQTPKEDEPWELDCEICHRRGWNLVRRLANVLHTAIKEYRMTEKS